MALTLVWAGFIAVYLGNWFFFNAMRKKSQHIIGMFCRRRYFEFAFLVPACLGVAYTMPR